MSPNDDHPDRKVGRPSFWRGIERIASVATIASFFGITGVVAIGYLTEGLLGKNADEPSDKTTGVGVETPGFENDPRHTPKIDEPFGIREPDPPPPPPVIEGWVFAGGYRDDGQWLEKELNFPSYFSPSNLDGMIVTSLQGSNVRAGPPNWRGKIAKEIGQVDKTAKLHVKEVFPWRGTWNGYYVWLRVQAFGGSRAAKNN